MTNSFPMPDLVSTSQQLGNGSDRVLMIFLFLLMIGTGAVIIRYQAARLRRAEDLRERELEARTAMAVAMREALSDSTHAITALTEAVKELRTK